MVERERAVVAVDHHDGIICCGIIMAVISIKEEALCLDGKKFL